MECEGSTNCQSVRSSPGAKQNAYGERIIPTVTAQCSISIQSWCSLQKAGDGSYLTGRHVWVGIVGARCELTQGGRVLTCRRGVTLHRSPTVLTEQLSVI